MPLLWMKIWKAAAKATETDDNYDGYVMPPMWQLMTMMSRMANAFVIPIPAKKPHL